MPRALSAAIRWSSLLERDRVELLGVVAGVVEEAAVGPERRVEVAQPDQVDARAGQAVGQWSACSGRGTGPAPAGSLRRTGQPLGIQQVFAPTRSPALEGKFFQTGLPRTLHRPLCF